MTPATTPPLLDVRDLKVRFDTPHGSVQAVNGVSWSIKAGATLGIIGESGSGKSVGLEAIMGLTQSPPGHVSGEVLFDGKNLLAMTQQKQRALRGETISMVFQDAVSSLNPGLTIGYQISEVYRLRRRCSRDAARRKAVELMDRVRIPSAQSRLNNYPYEFSGGMCQRVMIATALALDPQILIADEPTTALDVTVQRQIMDLLADLQQETGMALVLITHDLGIVAEVVDQALVMYAGKVVEQADVNTLFDHPAHPYTRSLMDSMPRIDNKGLRLKAIAGSPPAAGRIPSGCAFRPRCPEQFEKCILQQPALSNVSEGHLASCHLNAAPLDAGISDD